MAQPLFLSILRIASMDLNGDKTAIGYSGLVG
jgi:hypothetical protein